VDNFARHESDADDVGVAVFLAESESLGKMRADNVAVEDGNLTSAFEQQGGEDFGGRALA
jgi:hypothetical protein